ncbi:MAG: VWA domain-containing protein, partial [Bryobacteraceae bacterium]|nr:VWA domain-containing protein [Bryobacteraceae bacterium]
MFKLFPVAALILCVVAPAADPPKPPRTQYPATAAPADPQSDTQITLDVNRVSMLFTVSDKKGRFVTNLTKEDFEVIEDKKSQQIVEFAAESDLPLRLAVLIDSSNSIRDRFRFQQEAAVEFINSVMRTQDRAAVVSFDTGPELVADLT